MDDVFMAKIRVRDCEGYGPGFHGDIAVARVSPTQLEIRETDIFGERFTFGDIIEVESRGREFLFRRVVARSRYSTCEFVLSKDCAESTQLQDFLDQMPEGVHWERIMSGWLLIHVPEDLDYDPTDEILRIDSMS